MREELREELQRRGVVLTGTPRERRDWGERMPWPEDYFAAAPRYSSPLAEDAPPGHITKPTRSSEAE